MNVLVLLRAWQRSPDGALDLETLGQFERFALGTAFALRKASLPEKITVSALAAGSAREDRALGVAHALGVDKTYRVWDPILKDIDALGVGQALAAGAKHATYDLILAGARSQDYNQGYMGLAVAEFLGIPHLAAVSALRWDEDSGMLVGQRTSVNQRYTHRIPLPSVVTIAEGPDPGTSPPSEGHQPTLLTLEDVGMEETVLRPRMRLTGHIEPRQKEHYVTAFVDDAASIVEHLRDIDVLI